MINRSHKSDLPSSMTDAELERRPLLFKYLDIQGGKAMLTNSNLQFTNATKLNDPFDCHPGLLTFSENNLTPEMISNFGYGYFPSLFRDYTYVCSLSEIYDSILMWSYYTQEHKGICIGLNMKMLRKYIPYIHFDVKYPENLTKYDCSKGTRKEAFRYQLATKAPEWKHEKEVRLLIPPIDQDINYYRPIIGEECFYCIYLGVNIVKEDKNKIIELSKKLNPNIKIYQMIVNTDAFKLDNERVHLDL